MYTMIGCAHRARQFVGSTCGRTALSFWKENHLRTVCNHESDFSLRDKSLTADPKNERRRRVQHQSSTGIVLADFCSNQSTNAPFDNFPNKNNKHNFEAEKTNIFSETISEKSALSSSKFIENDLKCSGELASAETTSRSSLSFLKPSLPKKSFNLAPYVNESETLSNLVKLGVDLSILETHVEASNHILKMNFEKDVRPYLMFLYDNKVPDDLIGELFTKNPDVLREPLDNLNARVNYFKSKNFSTEAVARLISKAPTLLTRKIKEIDAQLGFLQRQFELTGDEVRLVATRFPKIIVYNQSSIQNIKMTLKDFLGFDGDEMKLMLIDNPKIYTTARHAITERFDFLHNTIGLSHKDILLWPSILRTRTSVIKPRYQFLKFVGRDQFDPKQANYVSLKSLITGTDLDFCTNIAKVPVQKFNDFLKTL